MGKKRILFLANHFITLYSFRKEMINEMVKQGHELYLSLPKSYKRFETYLLLQKNDSSGKSGYNL